MPTEPETIRALTIDGENDISLLEILDHVLNSGVVIHGSLVISLAGVDLVYVGLNVVLTSVETAHRFTPHTEYAAQTACAEPRQRRPVVGGSSGLQHAGCGRCDNWPSRPRC